MTSIPSNVMGIEPREVAIVKRGEAIAQVRSMEHMIEHLQAEVQRLERELQISHDRMDMLAEERTRWRRDAEVYRTSLIELASDMNSVNLITQRASETHGRVMSLLNSETPPDHHARDARPPSAPIAEALHRLDEHLSKEAPEGEAAHVQQDAPRANSR